MLPPASRTFPFILCRGIFRESRQLRHRCLGRRQLPGPMVPDQFADPVIVQQFFCVAFPVCLQIIPAVGQDHCFVFPDFPLLCGRASCPLLLLCRLHFVCRIDDLDPQRFVKERDRSGISFDMTLYFTPSTFDNGLTDCQGYGFKQQLILFSL